MYSKEFHPLQCFEKLLYLTYKNDIYISTIAKIYMYLIQFGITSINIFNAISAKNSYVTNHLLVP